MSDGEDEGGRAEVGREREGGRGRQMWWSVEEGKKRGRGGGWRGQARGVKARPLRPDLPFYRSIQQTLQNPSIIRKYKYTNSILFFLLTLSIQTVAHDSIVLLLPCTLSPCLCTYPLSFPSSTAPVVTLALFSPFRPSNIQSPNASPIECAKLISPRYSVKTASYFRYATHRTALTPNETRRHQTRAPQSRRPLPLNRTARFHTLTWHQRSKRCQWGQCTSFQEQSACANTSDICTLKPQGERRRSSSRPETQL